jgi:hypothetical protein
MQSVDSSFGYAVWTGGTLARSLSVSLPRGIIEDTGEPAEFERPFWERRQATTDQDASALGFHPLELGQQALRSLFGFVLEGRSEPGDADAWQVRMLGYRVTDPTGAGQAAREAALREFLRTHRRRSYRMGPDGAMVEIDVEPGRS